MPKLIKEYGIGSTTLLCHIDFPHENEKLQGQLQYVQSALNGLVEKGL